MKGSVTSFVCCFAPRSTHLYGIQGMLKVAVQTCKLDLTRYLQKDAVPQLCVLLTEVSTEVSTLYGTKQAADAAAC